MSINIALNRSLADWIATVDVSNDDLPLTLVLRVEPTYNLLLLDKTIVLKLEVGLIRQLLVDDPSKIDTMLTQQLLDGIIEAAGDQIHLIQPEIFTFAVNITGAYLSVVTPGDIITFRVEEYRLLETNVEHPRYYSIIDSLVLNNDNYLESVGEFPTRPGSAPHLFPSIDLFIASNGVQLTSNYYLEVATSLDNSVVSIPLTTLFSSMNQANLDSNLVGFNETLSQYNLKLIVEHADLDTIKNTTTSTVNGRRVRFELLEPSSPRIFKFNLTKASGDGNKLTTDYIFKNDGGFSSINKDRNAISCALGGIRTTEKIYRKFENVSNKDQFLVRLVPEELGAIPTTAPGISLNANYLGSVGGTAFYLNSKPVVTDDELVLYHVKPKGAPEQPTFLINGEVFDVQSGNSEVVYSTDNNISNDDIELLENYPIEEYDISRHLFTTVTQSPYVLTLEALTEDDPNYLFLTNDKQTISKNGNTLSSLRGFSLNNYSPYGLVMIPRKLLETEGMGWNLYANGIHITGLGTVNGEVIPVMDALDPLNYLFYAGWVTLNDGLEYLALEVSERGRTLFLNFVSTSKFLNQTQPYIYALADYKTMYSDEDEGMYDLENGYDRIPLDGRGGFNILLANARVSTDPNNL